MNRRLRIEWIPVVGFVAIGLRLRRLTAAIASANAERRLAPELVGAAWLLHDRWTVAFFVTLGGLGAIILTLTAAGLR